METMIDQEYLEVIKHQCENYPNATPWITYVKVLLRAYYIQRNLLKNMMENCAGEPTVDQQDFKLLLDDIRRDGSGFDVFKALQCFNKQAVEIAQLTARLERAQAALAFMADTSNYVLDRFFWTECEPWDYAARELDATK